MRLLNSKTQGFQEFHDENVPPYAILSHTWGEGEVSYHDMLSEPLAIRKGKLGWQKIEICCRQALADGLEFVWVDTCCIDKSSSAELQEAINSMFRWYEESTMCYAFIIDFEKPNMKRREVAEPPEVTESAHNLLPGLAEARWFTRGWTLQELLAPCSVRFFDRNWLEFGNKLTLSRQISFITGIRDIVLLGTGDPTTRARRAIDEVSVAQRMSWAANRTTTRVEDRAYCLMGIFDINMPLLYGEGHKSFQRLQEEVMNVSTDQTLLAWGLGLSLSRSLGVSTALARSPSDFAGCSDLVNKRPAKRGDSFSMTQRGLFLNLPIIRYSDGDLVYCLLNCTTSAMELEYPRPRALAVPMLRPKSRYDYDRFHADEYYRLSLRVPMWVEDIELNYLPRMNGFLPRVFRIEDDAHVRFRFQISSDTPPRDYFIKGIFPPEIFEDEYALLPPSAQVSAGTVYIQIASSKHWLTGFAVAVDLSNWIVGCEEVDGCEPVSRQTIDPGFAGIYPLEYSHLRDTLLHHFAEETLGEPKFSQLWDNEITDLGVDSLGARRIMRWVRCSFGQSINSDVLCTTDSFEMVLRKLWFATQPRFALIKSRHRDVTTETWFCSRYNTPEMYIAIAEVYSGDSIPTLVGEDCHPNYPYRRTLNGEGCLFKAFDRKTTMEVGGEEYVKVKLEVSVQPDEGIQLFIEDWP